MFYYWYRKLFGISLKLIDKKIGKRFFTLILVAITSYFFLYFTKFSFHFTIIYFNLLNRFGVLKIFVNNRTSAASDSCHPFQILYFIFSFLFNFNFIATICYYQCDLNRFLHQCDLKRFPPKNQIPESRFLFYFYPSNSNMILK